MTVSDGITNLLNEELFARRCKVLFLSNAGATIAKIAEECGVSTGTVRKDLNIAKRQYLADTPDERRAVQMSVIHDMRKANYPAMMRGDTDAANVILRGLRQEANLFGLFPKVLEVPGIDSVSAANAAAALIERIAAIDPQGLKEITRGHHTFTPDSSAADAAGAEPTGPAGDGEPAAATGGPDTGPAAGGGGDLPDTRPDDDDGWSNIGS
mgnify:CR=1 FL=1